MRKTAETSSRPTSGGKAIGAPVGGWNARDPIADMPSADAVFMDNFFPLTTNIMLRKGTAAFATIPADTEPGSPHNIRSLLSYSSPTGAKKLFAGATDGIYDITAGGAIAVVSSACTNGEWQGLMTATAGGSFLWCCNGTDKARYYTGSAWVVLDGASIPALTGVTSTDVVNVSTFKTRLILTVKDSLSFFYLPVVSVAGAASEFPLGSLFKRGGYLMATESWTLDAGDGSDDYFVAITSEGEVAVYRGTDPSNAATWALQGVYYVGRPLSRRCFVKVGGDLGVLTATGLYPLSKALLAATIDKRAAISNKLDMAFSSYSEQFRTLYGWSVTLFSEAPFILVNVPLSSDHTSGAVYSYQFVMNTMTGAWCRFTGMYAECWAVHDGKLYFACHNAVTQAWTGTSDKGAAIDGRVKTAFQYPFDRGSQGRVSMLRPILTTSGDVKLQLGVDTDYDETAVPSVIALNYGQSPPLWDTAEWNEAYWSSGNTTVAKWRSVSHKPGRAIALRLRVRSKGVSIAWNATDLILQRGGLL